MVIFERKEFVDLRVWRNLNWKSLILVLSVPNLGPCAENCDGKRTWGQSFWEEFNDSLTLGGRERVPALRHDFQSNEWSAGRRFLTKDYLDLGYIPCVLITAFIVCVVFEKTSIHEDIFLRSFQNYIAMDQEDVVAELVKGNFDANELIDVLNSFG